MIAERRILPLEGGLMTTLAVRAREQAIERRFGELAGHAGRDVGEHARSTAGDQVAERIGGRLTDEQAHALQVITGPERGAILVGPAGTGKGVVIDAAARAEQMTGHRTFGIAVSGSTAQRLGQDAPALAGQTLTLDALVARADRGQLQVDEDTTIYFDEAGMADTDRLDRLTEIVGEHRREARRDRRRRAAALDRRRRHVRPARADRAERRTVERAAHPRPGRTAGVGGPARRALGPCDGALLRPGSPAHGGHPR